ncbi:hypothetical protein ISD45_10510 [Pseudomonas aeruginosa]|jgi:hypothetical protein|uniref:hypothetical protein n=1 Tax=Pseudomonadota TaxID=1224 RepID=UPI000D457AB2|nr:MULTISPECIES: hypothetical protein [Pseudomonadota]MBX6178971.1 hypothetical protein [Pseudomonas aeruginosa]MDA5100604.1 hypothetical protein [Pseudomonas aeruginosa]GBG00955.1 hypothetical protein AZSI13_02820 [Azospira sp. I13]HBP6524943.1 hypothetical protein [Pseudomonas aeruginosa]
MIPNSFTPERREVFFQVLEDTCSPKQAAAAAGISRNTAFYHKANDHEFRSRWDKAVEVALDALLDEAYRRAALGYDEPVIHQGRVATVADPETGEERPLTVRKHSDRLLEVLLKFRYGEQMADRLKVKVEDTGLDADALLRMPSEERKALTELLAKYKSNRREEDDDE